MSLRVRWIPVAAASSGSASPTVDENYRSVRVTNKNTKREEQHKVPYYGYGSNPTKQNTVPKY